MCSSCAGHCKGKYRDPKPVFSAGQYESQAIADPDAGTRHHRFSVHDSAATELQKYALHKGSREDALPLCNAAVP